MDHKIVVAITGASGSIYAHRLLQKLAALQNQLSAVGLVFSNNARDVWRQELQNDDFNQLPFKTYESNDFMAPFASGSAGYNTMIVVPCSMGTLGRIAGGISNDLISRAADVILKERRKLICVARETPYNAIHLQNMLTITQAGGIICPATPSFYSQPKTIEQVADTVVDRVLDLAGLKIESFRWGN
jgi:flavin prenyltransferase